MASFTSADQTTPDSALQNEIQSVTPSGTAVKNRIQHLSAALHLFKQEQRDQEYAAMRRARIKGMIDGEPPYDQQQLEELGLGYMINVNFQEMRAILDAKAGQHYELFFEVPTLVECFQVITNSEEAYVDHGKVIAEEFSKMCLDWSGFLPFHDKIRREADAYGLGVGGFKDPWDWRPEAFSTGSFLAPKMAKLDPEKLPYCFLRDNMEVGELYRMALTDPSASSREGWKVKEVRRVMQSVFLKQANPDNGDNYGTSVWESHEQAIRNGSFMAFEQRQFETISVVHLLVKEIDDGTVSHYIFDESAKETDDFLFKASHKYGSMRNAMWWLPYNNGDGYLHSVRGLASMLETHCDLSNRYLGRIYDAGFTQASLILQPNTAGDMSQLQLVRMGIVTVIPPQLKAIQTSFAPNVGGLITLRDLSASIMKNNTGIYRQHPELTAEMQAEKTAYQVSQETAREARAEKSNVAFDYEHMDRLYKEMFNRALRPEYIQSSIDRPGLAQARAFVAACVRRGVPFDLLMIPGMFRVRATRAMGLGSWGVKLDLSNQVLSLRSELDEQGRVQAVRDWLGVRVGYMNVDKYKPLKNRDQIPSNETSIAALENNDMLEGSAVPVGSDQFHLLHFNTHAQLALGTLTHFQNTGGEGVRIPDTIRYLSQAIPHMQEHLRYLSIDPTRGAVVDEGVQVLGVLEQFLKTLAKAQARADKQQEQQMAEQQTRLADAEAAVNDSELQAKYMEIDKKYRLEVLKQTSLNQMRADKTNAQMAIKAAQSRENMSLKRELQNAQIALQREKVQADIELNRTKSMPKLV